MKSNSVSVLGAGSYGTALAFCLARNGTPTILWGRDSEHMAELAATRENASHCSFGLTQQELASLILFPEFCSQFFPSGFQRL